jgi:GT2 family glycosyltransferase
MTGDYPTISAIVPTWNALRFLPACIAALRAQLGPADEIILVDNASRDAAARWARRHAPDLRLLELPQNCGFAGGTNAGIAAARGELLLLCNDDALLEPGGVAALRRAISADPVAGAAAGVLTFSRRPQFVASAGIAFRRNGVAIDGYLGCSRSVLPTVPTAVFGASGGLALLRRTMIDDVGMFAAEFFNYLEDADMAWRMRLRGWSCRLAPQAWARHVYSASSGAGSSFKQFLLGRNRLRMLIRCLPAPLLRECLPAMLRYDLMALAYAALRGQPAMARGRAVVLAELPRLRYERRRIQARRTASIGALAGWLEAAPSLPAVLAERRRLQDLLQL